MHSDKQNLFLTTFKKWVLAKKSGQIPHSAAAWLKRELRKKLGNPKFSMPTICVG